MQNALLELLNDCDSIADAGHDEICDTAVREAMGEALDRSVFRPEPDYELPTGFEMFSPEGDALVHKALVRFLAQPEVAAARELPTAQARLDAFQDDEIISAAGTTYDEYFGYRDPFEA